MIGRMLAHYRVVEQLGAGGMGVVYRARDEQLERDVALKVLPPAALGDDAARKRFRQEALALSQLNHPHICTIYEVGEADGQTYIAMEYVPGRPLTQAVPAEGLALETALRYGAQIADALGHAHDKGLTHRDLKSANVMVTPEGRVKVLDFGLAKRTGAGANDRTRTQRALTDAGTVVGTLAYLAPEVLQGEPADARSDLWALGVMLHEMLSGARPFQGATPYALTSAILRESPPPLPERVPPGVRGVLQKCLAKEPGQRYQSAAEARAVLEAMSSGTIALQKPPPARARSRAWLAAAAVGVLILLAALFAPQLRRLAGPARIESVAVLPFDNLTRDPQQDFFADGMHEQLITDLSRIRALRVISRTSAMRYRGAPRKPLPQIARELGVDAVVEGSVMRSGDRVRITAQLLDARSDSHLWAESYDRDFKEILPLQREVARAIAGEIRITLTPQEQARLGPGRPVDSEVHQLVLRGQYFANKGGEQDLRTALGHFEQAVARDPNHAPAYAGQALCYRALSTAYLPPREVMPKAKAAARRAIELDDTLADAHLQLAFVLLFYDWDWPAAEHELQRALELSPSSASAHLLYASYFTALGRPQQSLDEIAKAEALDPLSLTTQADLLFSLLGARQFDRTIEQARRVIEREPGFAFGYATAALAWGQKGQYDKAIAEMTKAIKIESNPTFTALLSHLYAGRGDRREAGKLLAELESLSRRRYVCAYEVSHAYVTLGDKKQAFRWLDKGIEERADCMVWLLSEPWMDPIRGERRYKELLDLIGLAAGKPGSKP